MPKKSHFTIFVIQNFVQNTKKHTRIPIILLASCLQINKWCFIDISTMNLGFYSIIQVRNYCITKCKISSARDRLLMALLAIFFVIQNIFFNLNLDCCHVWTSAPSCYLGQLEKPQKRYVGLLVLHLQPLLKLWLKAVAQQLRHWIPNPGVPCSKPLGGSRVESASHPIDVDKMSTRISRNFVVTSKLPPRSGSSVEAVEPHP